MKERYDMKNVMKEDGCQALQTLEGEMRLLVEKQFAYNVADLQKRLGLFLEQNQFAKGQIVVWKDTMRNLRLPECGQPAIVVDVLGQPLVNPLADQKGACSPYFKEQLDLVIGLVDEDGDWLVFHVDSRRFRPLEG